jgi:hypothetical protein
MVSARITQRVNQARIVLVGWRNPGTLQLTTGFEEVFD